MAAVYKALSKPSTKTLEEARDSTTNGVKRNKQRVLVLCSRGVTHRHRHLMTDLAAMMPHGRRDVKFDSKSKLYQLNELAEIYNCNNVLFFEARKSQDLYMWLAKVPNGPTAKLYCQNIHTAMELNFTGNCLKGSRPILSFDSEFDKQPHLQLIRELLLHVFGVPQGARKSKPFIDHVLSFSIVDGKIWLRNYQINEVEPSKVRDRDDQDEARKDKKHAGKKDTEIDLVEIGPRMVMTPIVIIEGSFSGPVIYENRFFVSPNQVRADLRKRRATRHNGRSEQQVERVARRQDLGLTKEGNRTARKDEQDIRDLFS